MSYCRRFREVVPEASCSGLNRNEINEMASLHRRSFNANEADTEETAHQRGLDEIFCFSRFRAQNDSLVMGDTIIWLK